MSGFACITARMDRPAGRILSLAWPMLIAQLAIIANGLIDTMMLGGTSAENLATISLGASIYATVFVTFLGALNALQPIAAQHFGALRHAEIGVETAQAGWLALAFSAIGMALLFNVEPIIALASPEAMVKQQAADYLHLIALGMPAALLLRVAVSLNSAISRPLVTMLLNMWGVLVKIPLNLWFIAGGAGLPAMGASGCALATTSVAWINLIIMVVLLRRLPFYRPLQIRPMMPQWPRLKTLLALGLPMGTAVAVEVSSFTLIAVMVARLGAVVAGAHQILANLAALAFMLPLSLGSASGVLVAQAIGARKPQLARQTSRAGLWLGMCGGAMIATMCWLAATWIVRTYTSHAQVAELALSVFPAMALFHLFDAGQGVVSGLLRAHKLPRLARQSTLIYCLALWGVGLTGGWIASYQFGWGLAGFWICGAAGNACAFVGLYALLRRVERVRLIDVATQSTVATLATSPMSENRQP
jgi:MATE family multidrug resistance protein